MSKLGLLYRTLRPLKRSQLLYQGVFRVCRYAVWQKPRAAAEAPVLNSDWPATIEFIPPAGADACLDLETGHFRFIGLEHQFGSKIDWNGANHGKLWNYNLHYFEWLWGLKPEQAKTVVMDWMGKHVYDTAAEGWEPYPLSLRIQNWIGYWSTIGSKTLNQDSGFKTRLLESLDLQCDWLTQRLEKHLLGNHYLENGVALWMAGRFFSHSRAARWLSFGQAILEEQLEEQILADGMHFERSPMYHNRLIYLLEWLNVVPVDNDALHFSKYLQRARSAGSRLQHPDGQIALFNDSALGIYPEPGYSNQAMETFALRDAGYFGSRTEHGDYIVCDAGRIGPDYLPGHAHCDIGSFELSLRGERWITDSGIFHYVSSDFRELSRSTAAHNVFGPEGVEQAEIWSSFRVGNRPDVQLHRWEPAPDGGFVLNLSHDGFTRALRQSISATRTIQFSPEGSLSVSDTFHSENVMSWVGRLHFSPGVSYLGESEGRLRFRLGDVTLYLEMEGVEAFKVVSAPYWPKFNLSMNRMQLVYSVKAQEGNCRLNLSWS